MFAVDQLRQYIAALHLPAAILVPLRALIYRCGEGDAEALLAAFRAVEQMDTLPLAD